MFQKCAKMCKNVQKCAKMCKNKSTDNQDKIAINIDLKYNFKPRELVCQILLRCAHIFLHKFKNGKKNVLLTRETWLLTIIVVEQL